MFEERNEKLTAVIDLEVSEDILLARLLRRAKLEGRADDNEETIKKRFEVYYTQTKPLADYFTEMGVLKSFYYTDEIGPEGMVRDIAEYIKSL